MKNLNILFITIILLNTVFLFSCQKNSSENNSPVENTIIKISIPKVSNTSESNLMASVPNSNTQQEQVIHLEDGIIAFATLTSNKNNNLKSVNKNANTGVLPQHSDLTPETKYSLYVYNVDGTYVDHREYIAGQENSTPALSVSGGRDFIFVAFSVNSKTSLPTLENYNNLSTAKLKDITEDLMYFKERISIIASQENTLSIILKHQFSSITTTVKLSQEDGQDIPSTDIRNIYNVNDLVFSNISSSATLSLNDNSIVFAQPSTQTTKRALFNKTAPDYLTSQKQKSTLPTILISPNTTTAKVTIPAITITEGTNEHTLGNIPIENIKITPGYRYNLTIKIYKPSTTPGTITNDVNTPALNNHEFSRSVPAETATDTYYRYNSAADLTYGLTVDIHELDNSFNLIINDRPIAILSTTSEVIEHETSTAPSYEIEFQSAFRAAAGNKANIQFKDNNMYDHYLNSTGQRIAGYAINGGVTNSSSVPSIWSVIGELKHPTIRVVISPSGKVSLFGAKSSKAPLEPLTFRSDSSIPNPYSAIKLQDVVWNKNSTNTIAITQKKDGATVIKGTVRGFKAQ
ncbi:hypothetical protein [Sphingobacterium bovistauri]|uniref:Fimbrillin-A associated anchor protein Mfa1 and Mfa2 n=1 Tax=Sphingobacterium bovistauri TaxID=2781959 RepID=A0ABS7Z4T8_9SPHI|nr:hypothetical protein [Sphingobacterium bovistauri]MCA5005205.1 hypothetical protein [Sphingobacterium bovistauri]